MTDPIAPAPETAADTPAMPEDRLAELEARLAPAEAKAAQLNEDFLRAKAETENTRREFISLEEQLVVFREALDRIDALDRKGHDSDVAADMGYIARTALSNPARRPT